MADDTHTQQCGRIGSVLAGDDKRACGQHCLEDAACFWTYSPGGDYAGDCQLLGPCGAAASNRPDVALASAPGTMHSAGCFSWGDAEPVRSQLVPLVGWPARCCSIPFADVGDGAFDASQVPSAPLSMMSMVAGFGIALLVFGLPAVWWMRKSCKETSKNLRRHAGAETTDVENGGGQLQRRVPTIKNAARAIIHAQRAMDDLQRGMLRTMVAEMEKQAAQQLAQAQAVQIKGTRGERREALRQKHRHQRAALANQLDAVDMGLNRLLQDQSDKAGSPKVEMGAVKDAKVLARAESKRVLAQYDQHVEEMSKQLNERASEQSQSLEKKLEEKRELMKHRLLQMEELMERQGLSGTIVQVPQQPPGAPSAAAESAKKRQSRAVAVKKLDLTGDGHAESVGYDTNGDGVVDAIDYDGDGQIDAYLQVKEAQAGKPEFVAPGYVAGKRDDLSPLL